jgi:hypothetical protein
VVLFTAAFVLYPAAGAAIPPTDVATGAAEPSENSARVLGYFNYGQTYPPGIPDHCWFEYGTTVAYGARTDAICSGTTRATLEPLISGTTYHYRAAASNSDGTTYGPDKTFTTLGSPPSGTPPPPSGPSLHASLRVLSSSSLPSALRSGLRLRVAVSGSCPCTLNARLDIARRAAKRLGLKKSTSIASKRSTVSTGGTVGLRLRLKSSAKRKLRRVRLLMATVRVTVSATAGEPVVVSKSLRLKRPR